MMRTPAARAFSRTSFMRGAISPSRTTAFLQWCRSHMSQTMIAVREGNHDSFEVVATPARDLVWS